MSLRPVCRHCLSAARASPEPAAGGANDSQKRGNNQHGPSSRALKFDDDYEEEAAAADERIWLPYSKVGTCWSDADTATDGVKMQLGTFYQVMDSASILQLPVRVVCRRGLGFQGLRPTAYSLAAPEMVCCLLRSVFAWVYARHLIRALQVLLPCLSNLSV